VGAGVGAEQTVLSLVSRLFWAYYGSYESTYLLASKNFRVEIVYCITIAFLLPQPFLLLTASQTFLLTKCPNFVAESEIFKILLKSSHKHSDYDPIPTDARKTELAGLDYRLAYACTVPMEKLIKIVLRVADIGVDHENFASTKSRKFISLPPLGTR